MRNHHSRGTFSLALLALSTALAMPAARAQGTAPCPKATFDHVLVFVSDVPLPSADMSASMRIDPSYSFLKDVMHFSDADVQKFRADAEAFFRNRFGLDFSTVRADAQGIKTIPGVATMMPWYLGQEVSYHVLFASGIGEVKDCPEVRDGGLMVVITDPGFRYRGAYGGKDGMAASPGEMLPYGFYSIAGLGEGGGPLVIHYEPAAPMRGTVDGDGTISCSLVHPVWGKGMAQGLFSLFPTTVTDSRGQASIRGHVSVRNVLTFPGRVPDRVPAGGG